jgi:hypothetical protein
MVGLLTVQIIVVFFFGVEPRKRRLEELDAANLESILPGTTALEGVVKK